MTMVSEEVGVADSPFTHEIDLVERVTGLLRTRGEEVSEDVDTARGVADVVTPTALYLVRCGRRLEAFDKHLRLAHALRRERGMPAEARIVACCFGADADATALAGELGVAIRTYEELAAPESPAEAAAPPPLPDDLREAGWKLVRRLESGPDAGKYQLLNERVRPHLFTNPYDDLGDAVAAARKLQKRVEKHAPKAGPDPVELAAAEPRSPEVEDDEGPEKVAGLEAIGENAVLEALESGQRARWARLRELRTSQLPSEQQMVEHQKLSLEYERAWDIAVEMLDGDSDAVQEVRDRVEGVGAVDVVPRPARDDAYWREQAEAMRPEVEGQLADPKTESRGVANRRVMWAMLALADAYAEGELAEELFGLDGRDLVARLLFIEEFPSDDAGERTVRRVAGAGLDTPEKYAAARGLLLTLLDDYERRLSPPSHVSAEVADAEDETGAAEGETPAVVEGAAPPAGETLFAEDDAGAPQVLTQEMHPAKITTHPSTLMRAEGLDDAHVQNLREVLKAGRRFKDPVEVYYDGHRYWLADGNHRHRAAFEQGALLDVLVHKGTLRDAILHAVRANASHGLPRSNDSKRLAVVTLLGDHDWSALSDTLVAEMADVTQPFVSKVQGWLEKLLPLLAEDETGSDQQLADRSGAPAGLVHIVRNLPDSDCEAHGDAFECLTHNVMGRAQSRVGRDGKNFKVDKAPAATAPTLFGEGEHGGEVEVIGRADPDAPPAEIREAVVIEPGPADGPEPAEQLSPHFRLAEHLKAHPHGLHTDELTAAGFTVIDVNQARTARVIERHENGRCYYAWKADDIVAALREHGPLSRGGLEELGCQFHAVAAAEVDGHVVGSAGTYYLPEQLGRERAEGATPPSASGQAAGPARGGGDPAAGRIQSPSPTPAAREPKAAERPSVEERLKNRPLKLGLVWIPGVEGVSVTANCGDNAEGATRELVDKSVSRQLPEPILRLIFKQIDAADSLPAARRQPATKAPLPGPRPPGPPRRRPRRRRKGRSGAVRQPPGPRRRRAGPRRPRPPKPGRRRNRAANPNHQNGAVTWAQSTSKARRFTSTTRSSRPARRPSGPPSR